MRGGSVGIFHKDIGVTESSRQSLRFSREAMWAVCLTIPFLRGGVWVVWGECAIIQFPRGGVWGECWVIQITRSCRWGHSGSSPLLLRERSVSLLDLVISHFLGVVCIGRSLFCSRIRFEALVPYSACRFPNWLLVCDQTGIAHV